VSPFVGFGFSHEGDNKPYLKFYMKKAVLRIYQIILVRWGLVDVLPTLGPLESVAVLGLSVAFKEAFNKDTLQF
jgi:hypothetical protein